MTTVLTATGGPPKYSLSNPELIMQLTSVVLLYWLTTRQLTRTLTSPKVDCAGKHGETRISLEIRDGKAHRQRCAVGPSMLMVV